ncbi:cupin domain-containing protein [Nostoc sp. CHAB 5844]|nr:cupin domain-containing protein [Nostoc sp. CHAB 5844]
MVLSRIFNGAEFVQMSDGEPIRSVVTESADAVVVMWYVLPGQTINPHIHPSGQDTWIVLSGNGEYILDAEGKTMPISSGQIVVAHTGQVHGVVNQGSEPLQFVSVVAPQDAGYQPL